MVPVKHRHSVGGVRGHAARLDFGHVAGQVTRSAFGHVAGHAARSVCPGGGAVFRHGCQVAVLVVPCFHRNLFYNFLSVFYRAHVLFVAERVFLDKGIGSLYDACAGAEVFFH